MKSKSSLTLFKTQVANKQQMLLQGVDVNQWALKVLIGGLTRADQKLFDASKFLWLPW